MAITIKSLIVFGICPIVFPALIRSNVFTDFTVVRKQVLCCCHSSVVHYIFETIQYLDFRNEQSEKAGVVLLNSGNYFGNVTTRHFEVD